MRVKENNIVVGSMVLIKQDRKDKKTSFWDPNPFTVTSVKGSMVTAARPNKVTTRNCSFFKPYRPDYEEPEIQGHLVSVNQTLAIPVATNIFPDFQIEEFPSLPLVAPSIASSLDLPCPANNKSSVKIGRPTKDQQVANKKIREDELAQRLKENPPTRELSKRLAEKAISKRGGKM